MARRLAKSPFVLLALGLWILVCPASLAEDDDPNALNQQVNQLIEQGKYQEAIPIAERALEVANHTLGPDHPKTADALNDLGFIFQKIGSSTAGKITVCAVSTWPLDSRMPGIDGQMTMIQTHSINKSTN